MAREEPRRTVIAADSRRFTRAECAELAARDNTLMSLLHKAQEIIGSTLTSICLLYTSGQTYPEPSPYDRLSLDRQIRCAGEPVASVAAETPEAARKALDRIKVRYQVQEPLLDFTKAKDNPIVVHPEAVSYTHLDVYKRQYIARVILVTM